MTSLPHSEAPGWMGLRGGLRQFVRWLLRPFYRSMLSFVSIDDPWEVVPGIDVHPRAFGAGSVHPFEWYFERTLEVNPATLDELCAWLMTCAYVSDIDEFGVHDHWQHPAEFEKRRRGDCDDHALWAWRQLNAIGLKAEMFTGVRVDAKGEVGEPHAWIVFGDATGRYLMETTAKRRDLLVRPFDDVRALYQPFFSVNGEFRIDCFGGFALHLRRSEGRAAPAARSAHA